MLTHGANTVILAERRILLQIRADSHIWALPGGRVEPGETPEDAAIRETFEETGLQVRLERKVGTYWKPQQDDIVTVFSAQVVGGEIVQRSAETVDVRWFDQERLPWLMGTMKRYIADALAKHPEPQQATLWFSPSERALRRIAR
ncbi:MAG: NUDIX domain-containing protein, partial [Chloroflexota bacterium]